MACGRTMTRPSLRGQSTARRLHAAPGRRHALRSQRIRSDRRRGRHRRHGPRHHAGVGAGRHARHRLRREAGRRGGGQGLHRQDARRAGAEGPRCPRRTRRRAIDRISVAKSLEEVAKANVIIEAIIERLDAKQALFAKLDEVAGPDTIIASNTSSMPITAIASRCKRPERVGGMHFFNPVPLMRLRGGHPRPQDGAVGDGRHDDDRPAHDARAGAVHRQPGVPGQSRRPRVRAGGAAHPDREHRQRLPTSTAS